MLVDYSMLNSYLAAKHLRYLLSLVLLFCVSLESVAFAAVRGKAAKYVGGTVSSIKENTSGKFAFDDRNATFAVKGSTALMISFDKIVSLEYGQKAGRRVGMAIAINPLFLFSKKRRHFLTIGFQDDSGKQQGAVFELSKGIVHEILSLLETKSGKKVEYESEEARKHAEGH